jgi:regulatory protein
MFGGREGSAGRPGAPSLRERALRLLARRDYSRAELARKLQSEATTDERAEQLTALLDELEQGGYVSDTRYAEQRTGARAGRLGNARLAHELRTKGVDEAIIETALDAAGNEIDRARSVWQKKFGSPPASREDWAKQARFLQSRGFSSDTIRRLLDDRACRDASSED